MLNNFKFLILLTLGLLFFESCQIKNSTDFEDLYIGDKLVLMGEISTDTSKFTLTKTSNYFKYNFNTDSIKIGDSQIFVFDELNEVLDTLYSYDSINYTVATPYFEKGKKYRFEAVGKNLDRIKSDWIEIPTESVRDLEFSQVMPITDPGLEGFNLFKIDFKDIPGQDYYTSQIRFYDSNNKIFEEYINYYRYNITNENNCIKFYNVFDDFCFENEPYSILYAVANNNVEIDSIELCFSKVSEELYDYSEKNYSPEVLFPIDITEPDKTYTNMTNGFGYVYAKLRTFKKLKVIN